VAALAFSLAVSIAVAQMRIEKLGGRQAGSPLSLKDMYGVPTLSLAPLPNRLRDHGAVVARDRLYVIGGLRNADGGLTPSAAVLSYALLPGGALGPVREEKSLPRPLAGLGNACAAWENRVLYVAGGGAAEGIVGSSNRVLVATLDEEGVVPQWTESDAWPGPPLAQTALAVRSGNVFVVGGLDASGRASAAVYRASLRDDGTLGPWAEETPLPETRFGHATWTTGRRLLVAGGRADNGKPPRRTVFGTDISGTGGLGAWTEEVMEMPAALAEGSGIFLKRRLVWIGGVDGKENPFPAMAYTYLREDHPVPWARVELDLSSPIRLAAAGTDDGRLVYVCGGVSPGKQDQPSSGVLVLAMSPNGFETSDKPREPEVTPKLDRDNLMPLEEREKFVPAPVPRFLDEQKAFKEAQRRQRPMLLVVYSSEDKESKELRDGLLATPHFIQLMAGIVLGEVDIAQDPSARERYQAEKLPLFLVYDADGILKSRDTSARTLKDFAALTFEVQ